MPKKDTRTLHSTHTATSFTDGVNIACRSDGGVLLQFISETPDFFIDNHRTVLTKEGATELIDNLCDAIDYYPTKEVTKEEENTEETQTKE